MQVITPLSSLGRLFLLAGGTVADFATNALASLAGQGDDDAAPHDPWLPDEA
ncbi:MAG: hypothetical protein JOZ99_02845 [Actinobacteria bacterium]|nr:hypothetical protein [Actinomycetota bacterium]